MTRRVCRSLSIGSWRMTVVTLGLAHYPGTRGPGETKLPYNVVIGTFHGDWYTAAEIYRDWAHKQAFCGQQAG